MPAIDHPSTELALGGQIYWRDLAEQLAHVWWQVTEVGGNLQHGDLNTDTTFSIVLPQHGGYCFHGPTPMDAWRKAKQWLMSANRPDPRFSTELPNPCVDVPKSECANMQFLVDLIDIVSCMTNLNAGHHAPHNDKDCWCNSCIHQKAMQLGVQIRRAATK